MIKEKRRINLFQYMNYCMHHLTLCIHILFKELTEIVAAELLNVMC